MKSGLKIQGYISFNICDADGNVLERFSGKNLVVDLGRESIAKLLAGEGTDKQITQISFGTGTTAADVADTTITNPTTKDLDGFSYPNSKSVTYEFSLGLLEGNGKDITEFGLLSEDDTLFSRKVRTQPIVKTSEMQITDGVWTLIFD